MSSTLYRRQSAKWNPVLWAGIAATLTLLFSSPALAECDLSELLGYTLIAQKTIDGYIENGKRSDDFEGCDFDRIIVFDDNTGVRCMTYSYSYAYRPEASIFANGAVMEMCVDGELYNVGPIR